MYEHISRRDRSSERIEGFLKSNMKFLNLILYSGEVRRLERDFPEVSIEKVDLFSEKPKLYNCVVRRREKR